MQRVIKMLEEQRWLRREDALYLRKQYGKPDVPAPPERVMVQRELLPMNWPELAPLLASYNAFVRLWNVHESDEELMLSPQWWDGSTPGHIEAHRLILRRNDGSRVEVKLGGTWSQYYPGLSLRKHEVRFDQVLWAGKTAPSD